MDFTAIPSGAGVFVDANILIYHYALHPKLGADCNRLMYRIESGELQGLTTIHILGEMTHRLMILEAELLFGWTSKAVGRLKQRPDAVQQLMRFRTSVENVLQSRIVLLDVPPQRLLDAGQISKQFGLLSNDALTVAVMHG
ncbi:MAG: hypothetical protein DCC67_03205 [Planctomycetota bacterium]|nr:MAG: hypothetical protein DCC67_03205 [Planctomycetota bacterium]